MSKEFKNIDELFKSTIGQGNAVTPPKVKKAVLSAIGGGSWWLVGAALLLITAIGAITVTMNMPTENVVAKYQPRENSRAIPFNNDNHSIDTENNNKLEAKRVSNSDEFNNSYESPSKIKTAKTFKSKNQIGVQKPNNTITPSNKLAINKPLERKATADLNTQKQNKTQIENLTPAIKPNHNIAKNEMVAALPIQEKLLETVSPGETTPPNKKVKVDTPLKNEDIVVEAQPNSALQLDERSTNNSQSPELNLNTKVEDTPPNESNKSEIPEEPVKSDDIKVEKKPKNKKGHWMFGANVGPNINSAKYGSTEFGQSLSKFHDEKLGFQGQLQGQYITPSNFVTTLGVGLESQSYNTTFLTTEQKYVYETNSVFSHYLYDGNNMIIDTVYVDQDTIIEVTDLTNHYGTSKNQYLQIPLRFGYQIEKNKWIFGADLGIQLNYLLKSSGTYLSNNEVINQNNQSILKLTNFSYSLGGNIQYNVMYKLYLTGQIRYSPTLKQNYYEKSYGLRTLNTVALGFGIGLKL